MNINTEKKKIQSKFFIFVFFSLVLIFILNKSRKEDQSSKFNFLENKIIFKKKLSLKELKEIQQEQDFDKNENIKKLLEEYLELFRFNIHKNTNQIKIESINNKNFDKILSNEHEQLQIKEYLKNYFEKLLNNEKKQEYVFYFDNKNYKEKSDSEKINEIKDFFTVIVGTEKKYIEDKYNKSNSPFSSNFLFFGKIINDEIEEIKESLFIKKNFDSSEKIDNLDYNELIREKKIIPEINIPQNIFLAEKDSESPGFKVFIDDTTSALPIQWPSKLKWNYGFGWGYIWNVLIIFIGSLLSFFSNIFSQNKNGFFFGNLGLGIISTTIVIRTLCWPIYTKMSTANFNMSLMQPEINKIKDKYYLKKDKESMQKMQIEILKVYRKHNFNIFGIFVAFLQFPIFLAMFRTLNRFRVNGGIFFKYNSSLLPFLGFIYFYDNYDDNLIYIIYIVKILLSFLVGLSMLFLNRINLKKPNYMKQTNIQILTEEEKIKKQTQDKLFKIISYFMVLSISFASFKDIILALYWLVGNCYTILQTIINNKMIKKKFNKIKQKFI